MIDYLDNIIIVLIKKRKHEYEKDFFEWKRNVLVKMILHSSINLIRSGLKLNALFDRKNHLIFYIERKPEIIVW